MRADFMSAKHNFFFTAVLISAICLTMIISTRSIPMLMYNESEVYSCPEDVYTMPLKEKLLSRGNNHFESSMSVGYEKDPVTGIDSQDFFYDPVKCKPIY